MDEVKSLGAWAISSVNIRMANDEPGVYIHCARSDFATVRKYGTKVITDNGYETTFCFARNYDDALKTGRTRFAKFRVEQEGIV